MDLHLIHAGRFTHQQRATQITDHWYIGLGISGMVYSRSYSPSGKLYCEGQEQGIRLTPPGFKIDFCYNSQRENIVLICDIEGITYSDSPPELTMEHNSAVFPIQSGRSLSLEETFRLRNVFEQVVYLQQSPLPANIFAAEALCRSILAELAVPGGMNAISTNTADLADVVKKQLDDDSTFQYTFSEHCRQLGYSPEHARRCFNKKFAIDPHEYRQRKRLDLIFRLLAMHQYSTKEIAEMAGMKTINHLYAFIRQRCGTTPGELTRKLGG